MEENKIESHGQKEQRFSFFAEKRIWLNVLLFVVTLISTFYVGILWSLSYKYVNIQAQNSQVPLKIDVFKDPEVISLSIIYAVVLMGILLGHELGHFLTCRYYKIDATLPYFIPAPTLIGTLGAFIRIKSPITRKKQLFDIGVAGPLTGFILSIPALVYGLSLSKAVPSIPREGEFVFGEPLILKIIGSIVFKDLPEGFDIIIHPVAFAGWVGILVTSFNLFPVGQLDGGHVSYALIGPRSRRLAFVFLLIFIFMGIFFWIGWFIWAVIILFLGLKHPRIIDEATPLSPKRKFMGFMMILIFILSFIPDPIKGYNLKETLSELFNMSKKFWL